MHSTKRLDIQFLPVDDRSVQDNGLILKLTNYCGASRARCNTKMKFNAPKDLLY